MSLSLHLLIHVLLSLAVGMVVWRIWRKPVASLFGALLGGVFIDLDHLIDYVLVFGPHFRLDYFLRGYQFLQSGKVYVLFHGWEYVIILLLSLFFIRKKSLAAAAFVLSLAVSMLFHLCFDVYVNDGMTVRAYSVLYRLSHNFDSKEMVTSEHYENFLLEREKVLFLEHGNES